MTLRSNNRQRNARQARTGAHVDKTFTGKIRRHNDAIENMANQHLVGIAYGGEVVRFIPFVQHIDIGHQLIFLVIGERNTCLFQQTREFIEHGGYLLRDFSPGGTAAYRAYD
ncbi:Uncharacterised protein [Enterobacter cloacae]|nr:Uncharacterised protein [Enterobacter cloacae]